MGADADIEHDQPLPDWHARNVHSCDTIEYAFRSTSRKRFVWNAFLLRPMEKIMQRDWMLEVIHGFISQSKVSIFGRPVYVCLIARRSTRFAGTRYLKRGANFMGDVANEVETEQIVIDGHRLSSFVQMRGSVPSHWSQDNSKIVPKPPIQLDLPDPYSLTPGKHFDRLLFQFGAPIIILNLVKKRERRKHESILSHVVKQSVQYLNQFLPPQHRVRYVHFDMARKSRSGGSVMASLASIAESVVQQTGLFFRDPSTTTAQPSTRQTGLVRVNCVDCLDRTNTAQFAIGKCALAHQLCRMDLLRPPPQLEFDSDCITMLESLYEDHGDTLALQVCMRCELMFGLNESLLYASHYTVRWIATRASHQDLSQNGCLDVAGQRYYADDEPVPAQHVQRHREAAQYQSVSGLLHSVREFEQR